MSSWSPGKALAQIEKEIILEALNYFNNNRTHAARDLGISLRTIRNKLSEYRDDKDWDFSKAELTCES